MKYVLPQYRHQVVGKSGCICILSTLLLLSYLYVSQCVRFCVEGIDFSVDLIDMVEVIFKHIACLSLGSNLKQNEA